MKGRGNSRDSRICALCANLVFQNHYFVTAAMQQIYYCLVFVFFYSANVVPLDLKQLTVMSAPAPKPPAPVFLTPDTHTLQGLLHTFHHHVNFLTLFLVRIHVHPDNTAATDTESDVKMDSDSHELVDIDDMADFPRSESPEF